MGRRAYGGGTGGGVGRWPMEGGQRGRRAVQKVHWFPRFWLPKNRTTGLIWLVTRVGGCGEAWGGGPWRAGKGGDGGGHQRAVWEQQKMHWFPLLGSLKNLTTGLIWLVTRLGGWGEAWGGGPWRAGKGGDGGGAPESSVGATKGALVWFPLLGSLKNLTTGLIWLVTRVGGCGEAWGGGPWRAGKGGEQCGSNKRCTGSLKNLTTGLIWLVQGGRWGVGTREQCGSNKRCTRSLKNLTTGLIWLVTRVGGWGEAWGGGPCRAGKGGD